MQAETVEDRASARRRMERELRRLEALASRKRFRRRVLRALRGTAGAAATLGALVKLKLVGTLAGKVAIALAVGLGLAWPTLIIGIVGLLGLVLALFSLFSGEGGPHSFDCDWPCECGRREARARRLKHLIAQRRSWLAAPSGSAPSVRWDAKGRYAAATAAQARRRKPSRSGRPFSQ